MKKPGKLLHALSYLVEVPLGTHRSEYSPELKLSLSEGRYMLSVNKVIYSFENRYTSFKGAFNELDPRSLEPVNMLVLGYGLGSIPAILYEDHGLLPQVTAVDIDPKVLELASTYNHLPKDDHIRYIAQDARDFLAEDTGSYDIVAIDLFIDETVPTFARTEDFLRKAVERISPGGLLLFNWLYSDARRQQEADAYIHDMFRYVLPEGSYVSTPGNKVLYYKKPV